MSKGRVKGRICSCALCPLPHRVENEEAHRQEYETFVATQNSGTDRELAKSVARLAISKPLAAHPGISGTSTVFPPSNLPQAPAPHVALAEAEKSVRAVFSEALNARSKQPTREAQSDRVLESLSSRIQTAIASLQSANRASGEADSLWEKVDHAKRELAIVANSLKPLKETPEKGSVVDEMRKLEHELKEFTAKLPKDKRPLYYDSAYALDNPIKHLDVMAQIMILLGLVCNVILGLSIGHTNFIFGTVTLMIKLAMLMHTKQNTEGNYSYDALQEEILKELPSSLYTAMQKLNLDGKTVLYAACPSCHHLHAPTLSTSNIPTWPEECENEVVREDGRSKCATALLVDTKSHPRPIRRFLSHSFLDYLARLLSTPEIERQMDQTCDEALSWKMQGGADLVDNVFHGTLIQGFLGPDGNFFIDRGNNKRMRLLFGFSLDFFPPHGSHKRSSSASIGVLSVYCLNLPLSIRHAPENEYTSIITGPKAPHKEHLNPYLRPMVDIGVIGWERGIHLSSTGASPEGGRVMDLGFVLSANDLPAARDVTGAAQHNSSILCTVCECHGRKNAYRTDCESWQLRDVDHMHAQAEAWRDAETTAERNTIYTEDGLRYSELWRLPYWNPTRVVTSEPMHCIYEGLVAYHSRHVLRLNAHDAKKAPEVPPAYSFDFLEFSLEDETTPAKCRPSCPKEEQQIMAIHRLLVRPFTELDDDENDDSDEGSDTDADADARNRKPARGRGASDKDEFTEELLRKRLMLKNMPALRFVCWSLDLRGEDWSQLPHEDNLVRQKKLQIVQLLVTWRLTQPLRDLNYAPRPKTISTADLRFIQEVITKTTTPAWVHHVPKNFGEKGAGSIKADEWRLLATIYLPIALVVLWAEQLLQHNMALFQATTIISRYTASSARSTAYREFIKTRTNPHVALHLYDFLGLFGPVLSWWAFPIEHLIGILGKINSNNHLGGEHEATILNTWIRGANLRRWISRPDCPAVLLEFHRLFSRYLGINLGDKSPPQKPSINTAESRPAHYEHDGVHYSKSTTHLGNSLVIYLDPLTGKTYAGSIEAIVVGKQKAEFKVRRQALFLQARTIPSRSSRIFQQKRTRQKFNECKSLVAGVAGAAFRDLSFTAMVNECRALVAAAVVEASSDTRLLAKDAHSETVSTIDGVGLDRFQVTPLTRVLTLTTASGSAWVSTAFRASNAPPFVDPWNRCTFVGATHPPSAQTWDPCVHLTLPECKSLGPGLNCFLSLGTHFGAPRVRAELAEFALPLVTLASI
ncbi:hypothetical protein FB451DRAFT_1388071 [Mycena latifolia]|nr:hypothetical protein FB451DRAFT_1388071 [Mycena latifolia]